MYQFFYFLFKKMEKLTELNDIVFSVLNNEFNNKKKW
jgi:hypothetical protein